MRPLTLRTQTLQNSCVSACIAMLADVDEQVVSSEFNEDYHMAPELTMYKMLAKYGIEAVPSSSYGSTMYWGQCYLVSVPSLNDSGGTHQIIVDLRFGAEALKSIYDPQEGNPGCYHYKDFQMMCSFNIDARILDCPAFH